VRRRADQLSANLFRLRLAFIPGPKIRIWGTEHPEEEQIVPILYRDFPVELKDAISNARRFHEFAWQIGPEMGIPNGIRIQMFSGFLSIVFEHHDSTLRLLETGDNDASAFALARILLETFYRGFWMYLCASDTQVEQIRTGEEPYPKFIEMTEQVDQALKGTGKLKLEGPIWRFLCGLTHSGSEQLARRFNNEGVLVPNYPLPEVLLILSSATMLLSIMSGFFCVASKRNEDWKQINELWKALFCERALKNDIQKE
jgi:hypothetical protein